MTTSYCYAVMDERWNYDEDNAICLGVGETMQKAEAIQKQYAGSVIIKAENRG